jgi:predicted phage terminase large subunit-like protein
LDQLARLTTPRLTKYIPTTPSPKQAAFLLLNHVRDVFFGGAAGGGKSEALLMAALQYVDVPGYDALILRRTFADLNKPQAIMNRALQWMYPFVKSGEVKWNNNDHRFIFPSGATLSFGYLHHIGDETQYQGAEYQFCTAVGTRIVMADGSQKSVEDLRPGDMVMTLEGARPVSRVAVPRNEECVRADVFDERGRLIGTQVQSKTHPMLTPRGWHSYVDIVGASGPCEFSSSRECCTARRCVSPSWQQFHSVEQFPDSLPSHRLPAVGLSQQFQGHQSASEFFASEAPKSQGIGSAEFACEHGAGQQPALASVPVVLHAPTVQSARLENAHDYVIDCTVDGAVNTRICTLHRATYRHPYTRETRLATEPVTFGTAILSPCDSIDVVDITIAGVSHYFTTTGLINQNCAFDELTQFYEQQALYLFSRQRRKAGVDVPLRFRAASNPGGVGHEWVKNRYINPSTRKRDKIFIPSFLTDNPGVDKASYMESLEELDYVTRSQLLEGNWDATFDGGLFKRDWFKTVDHIDLLGARLIRHWDLAASEPSATNTDPDYTVGLLLAQLREKNKFAVLDVVRDRRLPKGVMELVKATAQQDGRGVAIRIEQEGGASGKSLVDSYVTELQGFDVRGARVTGDKVTRAKPLSAQVEYGNIVLKAGPWNRDFINEVVWFPQQGYHDDQVDAFSGAYHDLVDEPSIPVRQMAVSGW